jgi:hypothetical protein
MFLNLSHYFLGIKTRKIFKLEFHIISMNKYLEILIGLILVIIPILIVTLVPTFYNWGHAAVEFIKGGIVIVLIIVGILLVVLGISDLKG